MTTAEFTTLSSDLRILSSKIPLHWGRVQNNYVDDQINMFSINSYADLEKNISHLTEEQKNYLRRRWYLWKCSECDEYLFYINPNTEKNPNPYDKEFDVIINNKYKFDIKGTVIPKDLRRDVNDVINHPEGMIKFFYDKQSTGRRFDIQNRLFIVHHSFIDQRREFYLRCAWNEKKIIYKEFCDKIDNIKFMNIYNVKAGVIFILEKEQGHINYKISGL